MTHTPQPIRSDIAWSTRDRITVRGLDLPGEILGKMSLTEFAFLQILGQRPTPEQGRVFDAVLVTLVEHGLTPSAIVARLTYTGAPESLQSAVAAGISGLGSVFVGSTEGAARMLTEALAADPGADLDELARQTVARFRRDHEIIPGLGHPLHKPVDPRAPRLFAIAAENGLSGRHVDLMNAIGAAAQEATGKELPVNATGAIGALACELGIPWTIVRGIGVMARSIGLVGHILEESRNPLATEVWLRTDAEATAHLRPD
jgi:citrate synthase